MPPAPNFKGERAQLSATLFHTPQKRNRAHRDDDYGRGIVVGPLLKHDIKRADFPVPSSRIHTSSRRAAGQQKNRESRLCNPVLGRGTGTAAVPPARVLS